MSSEAQRAANRQNAQHSTGPKTDEGEAASSQNNHRHGLAGGAFSFLPWENADAFTHLLVSLLDQHQPQTDFEMTLVKKIAQHFWLSQRAVRLQDICLNHEIPFADNPEDLKLFIRYQATHYRAYHNLSNELRKLRNDTRKQDIGFESQIRKQDQETRTQATEQRRQNEEIRRAAAETRREANESRRSELHSKRLSVLDAQIARLATPPPATASPKLATFTRTPTQDSPEMSSQAA